MPVAKKIFPDSQMEIAGAAVLNNILWTEPRRGLIQKVMIKHSSATVRAPASAPNIKTDAKTKVSETERYALIDGTFTVNEPVRRVSAANTNHWVLTGSRYRVRTE